MNTEMYMWIKYVYVYAYAYVYIYKSMFYICECINY